MKICEKHKNTPALIYGECIGCELESLRAEVKHWKANHADLKNRLAVVQARPDLPLERLAIYDRFSEQISTMRAAMQRFVDRVDAGEVRSKKTYADFKAILAESI